MDASVEIFRSAGVPADKIVIGAAFYSRMWRDVLQQEQRPVPKQSGSRRVRPVMRGSRSQLHQQERLYTLLGRPASQAPYLFDGTNFISYDDEESIKAKCRVYPEARPSRNHVLGVSCDPTRAAKHHVHCIALASAAGFPMSKTFSVERICPISRDEVTQTDVKGKASADALAFPVVKSSYISVLSLPPT